MPWYWVLYWLGDLLALGLSIMMIIDGFKKNRGKLGRGLGTLACSIIVPVMAFLFCLERDVRTSEFDHIGKGLLSGNPVAYVILMGYGFMLYACAKTIRETWGLR